MNNSETTCFWTLAKTEFTKLYIQLFSNKVNLDFEISFDTNDFKLTIPYIWIFLQLIISWHDIRNSLASPQTNTPKC